MNEVARAWANSQRTACVEHQIVLIVLASEANRDGIAHISLDALAKMTRQSISEVEICLKDLEALGLLKSSAGVMVDAPYRYRLQFDCIVDEPSPAEEDEDEDDDGDATGEGK